MSRSLLSFAGLLAALVLLPAPALVAQDSTGPAEPAYLTVKVPADPGSVRLQQRDTRQVSENARPLAENVRFATARRPCVPPADGSSKPLWSR